MLCCAGRLYVKPEDDSPLRSDRDAYIQHALSRLNSVNSSGHGNHGPSTPLARQGSVNGSSHGVDNHGNENVLETLDAASGWKNLENPEEMDLYTPAVAADPSKRKRLLPGAVSKRWALTILTLGSHCVV
jgi:hypothetical protein